MGLNSVMLLLGISKAPFLTLLSFYIPSPALRVPLGALAEPPRCSPPSAEPWGPLMPQGEAESPENASLPQGQAGGTGNGVAGKFLCDGDGDGEGQELRGSRKNKMCTCGRAGGALCLPLCVSQGPEMEFRWIFPPGNAARGKGVGSSLPQWSLCQQERRDKLV